MRSRKGAQIPRYIHLSSTVWISNLQLIASRLIYQPYIAYCGVQACRHVSKSDTRIYTRQEGSVHVRMATTTNLNSEHSPNTLHACHVHVLTPALYLNASVPVYPYY